MKRTPRTLIANEGYDVSWTRRDGRFFNQPLPKVQTLDAAGNLVQFTPPSPNQKPTQEWPWLARGYSLVIPGNINTNQPLLLEDDYRNLLIFQNNSVAVSPDVAPNLFISLDGAVQTITIGTNTFTYNAITLVPGEGLVLDTRVLNNQIFVRWGSFSNGGGSVGIFGMCIYGRTPNSPPNQNAVSAPWGGSLTGGNQARGVGIR